MNSLFIAFLSSTASSYQKLREVSKRYRPYCCMPEGVKVSLLCHWTFVDWVNTEPLLFMLVGGNCSCNFNTKHLGSSCLSV